MLVNRKKGWQNKEHTTDNFVDSVSGIREPDKKQPKMESAPMEAKKESAEPSKFLSGMKTCNLGQSPEVQPRELLNI